MYKNNILETIGNTPLVKLNNIINEEKLEANLFAKVESFNPGGSVKDRVAYNMLKTALDNKTINNDTLIIEPTSGNTGIGLALVCAVLNLKCVIVMPSGMSVERKNTIQILGAELVMTWQTDGMSGAVKKAEEIKSQNENSIVIGQFVNPDNPLAHYKTTAKEILNDLDTVDMFVAGIGTGGTISGTGKALKEANSKTIIVGVEPFESPLITQGKAGPHKIQGIGANFIPDTFDRSVVDLMVTVKGDDAINMSRYIAQKEGILCGISSGAALKAAIEQAKLEENKGKNIVVLLPDTADHYFSTALFDFKNQ